jgi:Transposase, Mutator family
LSGVELFRLANGVEQSRFRLLDARSPNIGRRNGRWKQRGDRVENLCRTGRPVDYPAGYGGELDSWLGRSRYERRPEAAPGKRNGFRPRRVQTAEGELENEIPQVREAVEPFASKPFPEVVLQAPAARRAVEGDDR